MKKILSFALVFCLALTLCACGGSDEPEPQTLKIGVFEPNTGDSSSGGRKEMLGIQYAHSLTPSIVIDGITYNIELVYGDNASSLEYVQEAAANLIAQEPAVVIGTYGSELALAASPLFEEAGIAVIGVTCTHPDITANNDHYFRICYLDDFQSDVLANFASDKLAKTKVYCLGEGGNAYDMGLIEGFREIFESLGGTVISEAFKSGATDFSYYLNRALTEEAELIFIPVSTAYANEIMKQAAALEMDIPFLGSDTLDDNTILETVVSTGARLYLTSFYQEGASYSFDAGLKEYINSGKDTLKANGGSDTVYAVTAMGYDAYYVALEAVTKAKSAEKEDILAIMPGIAYNGISGSISFDETGNVIRNTAYIKTVDIEKGVWTLSSVQSSS